MSDTPRPIERLVPTYARDKAAGFCNTAFGCGQPVTEFRDDLSRTEFGISGLCQTCQDFMFGSDDHLEADYEDRY